MWRFVLALLQDSDWLRTVFFQNAWVVAGDEGGGVHQRLAIRFAMLEMLAESLTAAWLLTS